MTRIAIWRQPELTSSHWYAAMKLWREGKDTNDIASALRVKESYVYNNLPRYREADKRIMKRAGIAE